MCGIDILSMRHQEKLPLFKVTLNKTYKKTMSNSLNRNVLLQCLQTTFKL